MDISKVIGLEGGQDSAWFRVLSEEGRGTTKYYPAIVDGEEVPWSYFRRLEDYLAHKVERERETIRLTVEGNAIVAEEAISMALGCKALAISPTTVDVYPEQPLVDTTSAAAALGRIATDKKIAASRRNGARGGRPSTKLVEQLLFNADGTEAVVHFNDGTSQVRRADDEGNIDLSDLWFADVLTGKKVRWGEDGLQQVNGGWARL